MCPRFLISLFFSSSLLLLGPAVCVLCRGRRRGRPQHGSGEGFVQAPLSLSDVDDGEEEVRLHGGSPSLLLVHLQLLPPEVVKLPLLSSSRNEPRAPSQTSSLDFEGGHGTDAGASCQRIFCTRFARISTCVLPRSTMR
jgi:hypothetical protein